MRDVTLWREINSNGARSNSVVKDRGTAGLNAQLAKLKQAREDLS
jgi:hypothetical protein